MLNGAQHLNCYGIVRKEYTIPTPQMPPHLHIIYCYRRLLKVSLFASYRRRLCVQIANFILRKTDKKNALASVFYRSEY
jgi:hypothetical protein